MYNLEVYRDHNYMVSMDSILVHNSKYEDVVSRTFSNPKKLNHFIHGSKNSAHNWDLLVPDSNVTDLSKIAAEVLEHGADVPYESGMSKVLSVTRNGVTKNVQIPYVKRNGELHFSTGWGIP